jgi:hypothetical protein
MRLVRRIPTKTRPPTSKDNELSFSSTGNMENAEMKMKTVTPKLKSEYIFNINDDG